MSLLLSAPPFQSPTHTTNARLVGTYIPVIGRGVEVEPGLKTTLLLTPSLPRILDIVTRAGLVTEPCTHSQKGLGLDSSRDCLS